MKKLIITSNTYSWVPFISGMLMSEDSDNSIYIINKDYRRMLNCKNLCKESAFIQRQYDIVNIVEDMNVNDINFFTSNNEESLKVQIQLTIALKGIDEIYYPDWDVLNTVIDDMSNKLNLKHYKYKPLSNWLEIKKYTLSKEVYEKKIGLSHKMIGINSKKEVKQLYRPIERFF